MELPRAPIWKWEWNVNTVVLLVGLVGGWGYTWSTLEAGRSTNATGINRLENRVDNLEKAVRLLDNHELRISSVESQMVNTAAGVRSVETSIGQLSSDIRVVREILQRLEQRNGPDRSNLFAPPERVPANFTRP